MLWDWIVLLLAGIGYMLWVFDLLIISSPWNARNMICDYLWMVLKSLSWNFFFWSSSFKCQGSYCEVWWAWQWLTLMGVKNLKSNEQIEEQPQFLDQVSSSDFSSRHLFIVTHFSKIIQFYVPSLLFRTLITVRETSFFFSLGQISLIYGIKKYRYLVWSLDLIFLHFTHFIFNFLYFN